REIAVGPGDVLALAHGKLLGVCGRPGRPGWVVQSQRENELFTGVALSRDGKRLAAVSFLSPITDRQAAHHRLPGGDAAPGKRPASWELERPGGATAVALSPDGARVALGHDQPGKESISVHDAATGKVLHRLAAPPGVTARLAFSADGRALAAGGWKGAVTV